MTFSLLITFSPHWRIWIVTEFKLSILENNEVRRRGQIDPLQHSIFYFEKLNRVNSVIFSIINRKVHKTLKNMTFSKNIDWNFSVRYIYYTIYVHIYIEYYSNTYIVNRGGCKNGCIFGGIDP